MTSYTKSDLRKLFKTAEECYIDIDLYKIKRDEFDYSLHSNSNYYKYTNLISHNEQMLNEVLAEIKKVLEQA
jgi:hypothetical protein